MVKMAYSKEIREQALLQCQMGITDDNISKKMGVSKQTIGNWKKLLFTTGSLNKKKTKRKSGTPYKYTPDKIGEFLNRSKMLDISASSKSKDINTEIKKSKKKKKKKKF